MKKIKCILACVFFAMLFLVGCGNKEPKKVSLETNNSALQDVFDKSDEYGALDQCNRASRGRKLGIIFEDAVITSDDFKDEYTYVTYGIVGGTDNYGDKVIYKYEIDYYAVEDKDAEKGYEVKYAIKNFEKYM